MSSSKPDLSSDIRALEQQHEALRLEHFDAAMAWRLGCDLRATCEAKSYAMVIEVRLARRTVFFSSMPGSTAVNEDWARRKRNTAELFERSSYWVGRTLEQEGSTLEQKMAVSASQYASHGGALPILLRSGACVGCVTVSGVPQRQDHAIVVEALAAMCGIDAGALQLP